MKFYQHKLAIAILGSMIATPAMAGDRTSTPDFSDIDSDGDRRLNQSELQAAASILKTDAETMLQRYDRNQDSVLSQREYQSAVKQQMKAGQETPGIQTSGTNETSELAAGERSQITVNQKPAKITVHKPAAQVTVKQPQPEVTITTRDPQVQVSQPDPEVTVDQAQPNVSVNQAPPVVAIDQPEPVVEVDQPEPDVAIAQPEPAVVIEDRPVRNENPRLDRADTRVEDGERIRAPLAETGAATGSSFGADSNETLIDVNSDPSRQEVPTAYSQSSEPSTQASLYTMPLDDLRSGDIMDADGEKFGSITDVMIKRDGGGAGLVLTRADDNTILFAPLNAIDQSGGELILKSASEAGEVGADGEYSLNDYISAPDDADTLGEALSSNAAALR